MRNWARAAIGSGAAIVVCFANGSAHAFPSTRLVYVRGKGAERCPDEVVVRDEVTRRLGYDPFFLWAERTIVVRINREGKAVQALIELLDGKGNVQGARTLRETSDCEELVRSVALAISIGLDPESASAPPLDGPAAEPQPPAPPPVHAAPAPTTLTTPPPAPPRQAPPPRRAGNALDFVAGAGVWSGVGWAPPLVVGASVGIGAALGPLRVSLEGRGHLPGSRDGVAVDVLTALVVPCYASGSMFACALGLGGRIHAQGSRDETARFLGVGGRIGARWPVLQRTWLRVFVDGVVPYDRTTVERSGQTVWRLPPVSASLTVDVESHLW